MYTLEQILDYVKMPEECARLALECLERVKDNKEFIEYKEILFRGEGNEYMLDDYAESIGERPYMLRLAFCLFCTDRMYEVYKAQGMSDKVYLDSLIDLRVWALTYKRNFGEWGMKEFKWLTHALRGKVCRFGRLQFERNNMEHCGYHKHGVHINKHDEVIGVHIPEDGRMSKEERLDAYRQAYEYYKNPVFICETYLFYPAQKDFLPETSNILAFMNEFDVVYYEEDSQMRDMWRIFGMRGSYDPNELPRDTSLQRAYADHLARTGKNGMGYGVMVFDGERILTQK